MPCCHVHYYRFFSISQLCTVPKTVFKAAPIVPGVDSYYNNNNKKARVVAPNIDLKPQTILHGLQRYIIDVEMMDNSTEKVRN